MQLVVGFLYNSFEIFFISLQPDCLSQTIIVFVRRLLT